MARTNQTARDSKGRYVKLTILNKIKAACGIFSAKLDKWLKSCD